VGANDQNREGRESLKTLSNPEPSIYSRDVGQRSERVRPPQLNNIFPRLFSAVPAIPALLGSFMRNINANSPSNTRTGRQLSGSRNSRNTRPPIVYTQYGGIEGYYMGTMKGRKILAFEGIPFAEPPVGKYRFKVIVSCTMSQI